MSCFIHSLELVRFSSDIFLSSSPRVCVCVIPFILDVRVVDVMGPHRRKDTGFLIYLPCALLALILIAIQPFLSLVDRKVEFCVLTN